MNKVKDKNDREKVKGFRDFSNMAAGFMLFKWLLLLCCAAVVRGVWPEQLRLWTQAVVESTRSLNAVLGQSPAVWVVNQSPLCSWTHRSVMNRSTDLMGQ